MTTFKVNDKVLISKHCYFKPLAEKAGIVTACNLNWEKPYRIYIPGCRNARSSTNEWYFYYDDLCKVYPYPVDDNFMNEWERKWDEQKSSEACELTMPYLNSKERKHHEDLWSAAAKVLNNNDNLYLASDSFHSTLDSNCGLKMNVNIGWMIKDVIFNPPATIILWNDGNKTVVKCSDNDEFDKEKGFAMALSKYILGNRGSYYDIFKKFDAVNETEKPNDEPECSLGDQLHDIVNNALKKAYIKYVHETEPNQLNTKPKKKILGVRLRKKDDTEKEVKTTYKDVVKKLYPNNVGEAFYGGVSACPGVYIDGAPRFTDKCFNPFLGREEKNVICTKCWNSPCPDKEDK